MKRCCFLKLTYFYCLLFLVMRTINGQIIITSNTTIATNDFSYDGTNLIVQEGTLTISGLHYFASILVETNGVVYATTNLVLMDLVLTNSSLFRLAGGAALTVSNEMALWQTSTMLCYSVNATGKVEDAWSGLGVQIFAGSLIVDSNAVISANGQGYLAGRGPGAGPTNTSSVGSGASYGGRGSEGSGVSTTNTYGSILAPLDLGSGGGANSGTYGAGGGAIRLDVAGLLTLNGIISADGNDGESRGCGSGSGGGGAGGSIYITAGSLAGSGFLTAYGGDGGNGGCFGESDDAGGGGGGRIAVYYGTNAGFTGFTNASAMGGLGLSTNTGESGTVGFFEADGTNWHLKVYERFAQEEDTTNTFAHFTLYDGAYELGGGGVLNVTGNLSVSNGATLFVRGKNQDEKINSEWCGRGGVINAGCVNIASGALVTASGEGYLAGKGPGAGLTNISNVGSGASYGGRGSEGSGVSTTNTYGSIFTPLDLGSGGGANSGTYGAGGGAIRLNVTDVLTLNGTISANGNDGESRGCPAGAGGGGSGGSIYITAGSLAGAGFLTAYGGDGGNGGCSGESDDAGGGGGGRIAVYYGTNAGFTGFTNASAMGGLGLSTNTGGSGTVGFFEADGTNWHLKVYERFAQEEDTTNTFAHFTLHNGATYELGGGSILNVANNLNISNAATLFVKGKNQNADIDGCWRGSGGTIQARNVNVAAGGVISASGEGYAGDKGPGAGLIATYSGSVGSGGSYGGRGGDCGANSGVADTYGASNAPIDLGSGGGASGSSSANNSAGGGAIRLVVSDTLALNGIICSDGNNGESRGCPGGAGGGGAGGSIYISAGTFTGAGALTANGGNGGDGGCFGEGEDAGGGAGGRIAVYYQASSFSGTASSTGGVGVTASLAGNGTVLFSDTPTYLWENVEETLFHGVCVLRWAALAVSTNGMTVEVRASGNRGNYVLSTNLPAIGQMAWDTTLVNDGEYELKLIFRNAAGTTLQEVPRTVVVNNTAVWHGGCLTNSATWTSSSVHIVQNDLIVYSNVTLTISPGTIIKFAPDKCVRILNGGTLMATGTTTQVIIMTSLADDSAGGDSNMDGTRTLPQAGDWGGIEVQSGGTFNYNAYTELRYIRTRISGTFNTAQTWYSGYLYSITDNVTIASGATLTIEPGAIIKFANKKGLTINAGCTLLARGTVAQPIYFTSWRDDSVGGDTDEDGGTNSPAAGDWLWLKIVGTGVLDNVYIKYAGGSVSGPYDTNGALHVEGNAAVATMSGGMILDAQYDAVMAKSGAQVAMSNCVIARADRGINPYDSSSRVRLYNCTLDDNRIGVWGHSGTMEAYNTIISHSLSNAVDNVLVTPSTYRYCNFWSETGTNFGRNMSNVVGIAGNISADPCFKNWTNDNWRLNYGSPCIDAADGAICPTNDIMGAPRYTDPRSVPTGVPAPNGAYPDMGAYEFVETAVSDIDLVVENVAGPASAVAGTNATVQWTVRNRGTAPIAGSWHDAIYLVPVAAGPWDEEVYVGEVLSSGTLAPNGTLDFSAEVSVPGGTEGMWRWKVKTNWRGEVFEGVNWYNNAAESAGTMQLQVPTLTAGVVYAASYTGTTATAWFKFTQAANTELAVYLDSASAIGNSRLFSGYGRMPSESLYHLASSVQNTPDAVLPVPATNSARTVYLLVKATALAASNLNYTILVTTNSFGISRIGLSQVGNAGSATIPIYGSMFDTTTCAELRKDGTTIAASAHNLYDSATLYATFDLNGAAVGLYSVAVIKGGDTRVLTNALSVVMGNGGELYVKLLLPSAVRAGRQFTAYLEYGNIGDADLDAPLLLVRGSGSGVYLWDDDTTNSARDTITYLGVSQNTPQPSILPPGEKYRVAFHGIVYNAELMHCEARYISTEDRLTMDYAAVEEAIRPAEPHPYWSNAWLQIVSESGNTRGEYVQALGRAADRAKAFGLTLETEQEVLDFMLREKIEDVQVATVSGRVYLNSTNTPLGRVLVMLTPTNIYYTNNTYAAASWYDGRFGIRDVPAGVYNLSVYDYLPTNFAQVTVSDGTPVAGLSIITTARCAHVIARVTYGLDGSVVTGGTVVARDGSTREVAVGTVTNGACEIVNLLPDDYVFEFNGPGYMPVPVQSASLSADETYRIAFAVASSGGMLTGRVFNANGGVAGATVVASWDDYTDNYGSWHGTTTTTDNNGLYCFAALPLGQYSIYAGKTNIGLSAVSNVTLASYSTPASLQLYLEPGVTITVRVTRADNNAAVSGAVVTVDEYFGEGVSGACNSDGKFVFSNVSTGWHMFGAHREGYFRAWTNVEVKATPNNQIELNLSLFGTVAGTVRNGGQALAGVTISLVSRDGNLIATTITDTAGNYRFENVQAGTYSIMVGDVNNGASLQRQDITVSVSGATTNIDFNFTLGSISGVVYQVNGATPLTNATVYVAYGDALLAYTRSDSQGRYEFKITETGTYAVMCSGTNALFAAYTNVDISSSTATQTCNFVMGTGGILVCTRDSSENPVTNACVTLRAVVDQTGRALRHIKLSDISGQALFDNLAAGSYYLEVLVDNFAWQRQLISAVAGSTITAVVNLANGRVVSGQITDTNGTAIHGACLALCNAENGRILTAVSDEDGNYAFTCVPTGMFNLVVTSPDYTGQMVTGLDMSITAIRTQNVALSNSLVGVSGSVVDGNGLSVGRPIVAVMDEYGNIFKSQTADNGGEFAITNVPRRTVSIKAQAEGCSPIATNINTAGGSIVDVIAQISRCRVLGRTAGSGNQTVILIGPVLRGGDADGTFIWPWQLPWSEWRQVFSMDFIFDIVDGNMGLPNPYTYHRNFNIDWMRDFLDPACNAARNGRFSCLGVQTAYNDGCRLSQQLDRYLTMWMRVYDQLCSDTQNDVKLVLTRGGILAGNAIKFAGGFTSALAGLSSTAASFADFGASLWAMCAQNAATGNWNVDANGMLNHLNNFFTVSKGLIDGSATPQRVLNTMQQAVDYAYAVGARNPAYRKAAQQLEAKLSDLVGRNQALARMAESPDFAGKVLSALGLINDFNDLKREIETLDQGVVTRCRAYMDYAYNYFDAVQKYHEAKNRMMAAISACTTGDDAGSDQPDGQDPSDPGDSGDSTVLRGRDPNTKIGIGYGVNGYIGAGGTRLYYTIYFENVATASAPAQVVTITDQLDSCLDWSTVELGNIGFNNVKLQMPQGVSSYATSGVSVATDENPVRIAASFNPSTGVITWELRSVDRVTGGDPEDPWSGFLPPNTNEPCGEGYVSFSVAIPTNLGHGIVITNAAVIVFDVNDPIWTPSVTNTIDLIAPTSCVCALPAVSPRRIMLDVSAADNGSGVASFDLYVSVDGGAFAKLLTGVTGTTCIVTGFTGHAYGFMSRARDNVGNLETMKYNVEASTYVNEPMEVTITAPVNGAHYLLHNVVPLGASVVDTNGIVTQIVFYVASTPVAAMYGEPWSGTWLGTLPGRQELWARAWDNYGLVSDSDSVYVQILNPWAKTDYDGDGRSDLALCRAIDGIWKVKLIANFAEVSAVLGNFDFIPVPADYDGDGKTDPGMYKWNAVADSTRPIGTWRVFLSGNRYAPIEAPLGNMALPVSGSFTPLAYDFDGDGKADPGLYYAPSGYWAVMLSGNGYQVVHMGGFGSTGYLPAIADYDADGKADPVLFNGVDGSWLARLSAYNYQLVMLAGFGVGATTSISADYDGDWKADPAVYYSENGTWRVRLSGTGYAEVSLSNFGGPEWLPALGDYDGDAKTDPAIFNYLTGTWQVRPSTLNYVLITLSFGTSGDRPAAE